MTDQQYQTGLFFLELDCWSALVVDDLKEMPLDARTILEQVAQNPEPSPPIPTLARATCQVDLLGQVLIQFHIIVAEGFLSPFYEIAPCIYLRHDRVRNVVELILDSGEGELSVEHRWDDVELVVEDLAAEAGITAEQAGFEAIMELVVDSVHVQPLEESHLERLRALRTSPASLVDTLLDSYGAHRFLHPAHGIG